MVIYTRRIITHIIGEFSRVLIVVQLGSLSLDYSEQSEANKELCAAKRDLIKTSLALCILSTPQQTKYIYQRTVPFMVNFFTLGYPYRSLCCTVFTPRDGKAIRFSWSPLLIVTLLFFYCWFLFFYLKLCFAKRSSLREALIPKFLVIYAYISIIFVIVIYVLYFPLSITILSSWSYNYWS